MMICASVMLAVFLGWPLAFGGGNGGLATTRAVASSVTAPAAKVALVEPRIIQPARVAPQRPESCYKRYQRSVRQCEGYAAGACRMKSADQWDICEATGFWPE